DDVVNSPSFTLMAEYAGRLRLFHQDLYRLSGSSEAIEGGLLDDRQEEGVTLTEWAERLDPGLDAGRLEVRLTVLGDEERQVEIVTDDVERFGAYLAAARGWEVARGEDR